MINLTRITSVNLLWIHIFSVFPSKQVDRKLRTTQHNHLLSRLRIAETIVRIAVSFSCPHKRDSSRKETTIIETALSLSRCMNQLPYQQGRIVSNTTMHSGSCSNSISHLATLLLTGMNNLSWMQLRRILPNHHLQSIIMFTCKNELERYVIYGGREHTYIHTQIQWYIQLTNFFDWFAFVVLTIWKPFSI